MEIVEKKPSDLIPYANNSRTHSDGQVAQICASIREYGFTNPILIDEEGTIIAGHGRAKAAMRLGMESVPCIVLRGLTKAQKKAYVIADNKMALNAGWDEEKLRLELEGLKELDFDLSLTGFSEEEMKDLLDPDGDPDVPDGADDAPEPEAEAVSKPGDVWILGGHRLMCGDSTDPRDVARLMGGGERRPPVHGPAVQRRRRERRREEDRERLHERARVRGVPVQGFQKRVGRPRARPVRRERVDHHRLRAAGAQVPVDGIRPQVRGRHRPEMGEVYWQEGDQGGE